MNVYDFDGTVYRGDSTVDFWLFCLRKKLGLVKYIGKQFAAIVLHLTGKIGTAELKSRFLCFLSSVDGEKMAEQFADLRFSHIEKFYLETMRPDDVIISASPEFLLKYFVRKLGAGTLIATKVDPATGKLTVPNCKGEEKVRRFLEKYPVGKIESFFSDSESDLPMARLAERAFRVKKGKVTPWKNRGEGKCNE